jgi:hypothetical protein
MNFFPKAASIQERFQRLCIVCGGVAFCLLLLNGLVALLHASGELPSPGLPSPVPAILFSVGVAFLAVSPAVKGAIFKRADAEGFDGDSGRRFAAYQKATLVAFALREAGALIGFVLAVLTGNPWWSWGLGGAALIAMAMDRPRREHLGV